MFVRMSSLSRCTYLCTPTLLFFGYEVNVRNGVNLIEARNFRAFFMDKAEWVLRQKKHMIESALFSEIGKTNSVGKTLCNITPVSYAGTRIQV